MSTAKVSTMTGYSSRAAAIMSRTHPEQRKAARMALNLSGTVAYANDPGQHLALTRDLGAGGAFFYCEHAPALGADITFTFLMPVLGRSIRVIAHGKVIRLDRFPGSCATGVAAQFDRLLIPENAA